MGDIDVYAEVGKDYALIKTFNDVFVNDGSLDIVFHTVGYYGAMVSGIEVLRGPAECTVPGDTDPCDDCVSQSEIVAYINRWFVSSQDVSMVDLIRALEAWKAGGC